MFHFYQQNITGGIAQKVYFWMADQKSYWGVS